MASERDAVSVLTFSVRVESGGVIVGLLGEIDITNADTIPVAVLAVDMGAGVVVVDLAGVSFMDSAGLNAILACKAGLDSRRVSLTVRNPSDRVRRVFEITGLQALLE